MKHFYLLFFVAAFYFHEAQTLTQSFNEPIVGDVDKSTRLDTSAYTSGLPNNVTGNNCSWDFSKLIGIFPMIVDSFVAPSAAINASAYPAATYAQHRDIGYTFYKSSTSPSQTELLGAYSPSLSLTFTNTAIIAGYPVNYGYNLNDPVSGSFKYNTTNGGCNGNIVIAADGVGTVHLANGVSVPNVIRLKSIETLTLNAGILPVGSFQQVIYNYYAPGLKFPVINVGYTIYQLLAGTPTITALAYGNQNYFGIAGINQSVIQQADYQIHPNPFHEAFSIQSKSSDNEFLIYSLTGQLLLNTKEITNSALEPLAKGIYLLEIKNKDLLYRQKIVKD